MSSTVKEARSQLIRRDIDISLEIWKENNPHAQLPQKIIKEGQRVALIVSKLLSFARVDTEEKQAVNNREVINDTLDLTGTMLKKEFIAVKLDVAPMLPRCRAVPHQLLQIFLNIIGNARYALNLKYPDRNPNKRIRFFRIKRTFDMRPEFI